MTGVDMWLCHRRLLKFCTELRQNIPPGGMLESCNYVLLGKPVGKFLVTTSPLHSFPATTVRSLYHKLLRVLMLSCLTVSMLLSNLGLFQSHSMALLETAGHESLGELHGVHAHDDGEGIPGAKVVDAATHSQGADNVHHGHNPLDHSHETPLLPPLLADMTEHFSHRLAAAPTVDFIDREPWRLERPPMQTTTL